MAKPGTPAASNTKPERSPNPASRASEWPIDEVVYPSGGAGSRQFRITTAVACGVRDKLKND